MATNPNLTAGLRRFARTIVTKRDGTCDFCGAATRSGVDYAAVDAASKWTGVCQQCAGSITEQCKGVVRTMNDLQTSNPSLTLDTALASVDMALVPVVLSGQADEAASYDMLMRLTDARRTMLQMVYVANAPQPDATTGVLVDRLRVIANDANAKPRDREFAASLVQWFDRKGSLTPGQIGGAERMVDRLGGSTVAPLECGVYLHDDGTIHKLYMTQNDRLGCKLLHIHEHDCCTRCGTHTDDVVDGAMCSVLSKGGRKRPCKFTTGGFEYVTGGTSTVRKAVAAGTARKLAQAEAEAFGTLHGFCGLCGLDIDDDRSLAVGYGPVCAENNDWFYPTMREASEILDRLGR